VQTPYRVVSYRNGLDLRPVKTRPKGPRAEVEFLGWELRAPSPSARRPGERCKFSQWGPGEAPENLHFGTFWDLRNHVRTVNWLLNLGQQVKLGDTSPCPNVDPPMHLCSSKSRPLCFDAELLMFLSSSFQRLISEVLRPISEVPRPIAPRLSYMLGSECNLRNWVRI